MDIIDITYIKSLVNKTIVVYDDYTRETNDDIRIRQYKYLLSIKPLFTYIVYILNQCVNKTVYNSSLNRVNIANNKILVTNVVLSKNFSNETINIKKLLFHKNLCNRILLTINSLKL